MRPDEYAQYDATGLAELIRGNQVSVAEVHDAARGAIEAVNPALNAVVAGPWEAALDCDGDGIFAGIPFALKDFAIHAAGVPTRFGSRLAGQGVAFPHDTELMKRFRTAGLAAVALTTTPEFAFNGNTEPVTQGSTRNPWDRARSAGGSSGGSAVLVAARALPMAHATDGGGSIRIPASANGLVGLKPSRGRVSVAPDASEPLSGLGVEFGLTRSVRDCAALLDAVSGAAPGDKYVIRDPARPYIDEIGRDPGGLRIAIHTESWSGDPVDPEVVAAVAAVGSVLEGLGHHVRPDSPAFDWDQFVDANLPVWSVSLAEGIDALAAAVGTTPGPHNLEATTLACAEHGRRVTATELAVHSRSSTRFPALSEHFSPSTICCSPPRWVGHPNCWASSIPTMRRSHPGSGCGSCSACVRSPRCSMPPGDRRSACRWDVPGPGCRSVFSWPHPCVTKARSSPLPLNWRRRCRGLIGCRR